MKSSVKLKNKTILNHISKLISSASYRYECNSAIITGEILINELSNIFPIKTLLSNQENYLQVDKSLILDKLELKKISKLPSLQGPIAEIPLPNFQNISNKSKIAILDQITDPGNMGTIIRSALAFGIEGIHITKGSCDPFNDKVIRSSKGAVFKLPISYEPFTPLDVDAFYLLLADMNGPSSYEYSFEKKTFSNSVKQ